MTPSIHRGSVAGALLALTFALPLPSAQAATEDRPGDYSHAIPVSVSGRQAIVQLPLPRTIYLAARSADLRDLRVFDAAGTPMPFALTRQAPEDGPRRLAPAAVFPVHAPADNAGRLQDRLQIRTGTDGAVISVTAPAAGGAGDVLASLVLDLRPAGTAPDIDPAARVAALVLALPPGVNSYSAELLLEASDDLQEWEEVAQASVSWLANSQGARVRKDRIAFAPRAFRYARLRWLEGRPIEFASVGAEYVGAPAAARGRESVLLQPATDGKGDELVYAAPVAVPVEALGLQFGLDNVVLPALIGRYHTVRDRKGVDGLAAEFRPLVNTTFYQMTQNGQRRASGDIEIAPVHAAQWVVRPQGRIADRPQLRLRWTGATMVFLAGGKGPYTLAVGRDGVASSQVPLEQVAPGFSAQELAALESARAGAPVQQHASPGGGQAEAARKAALRRSIWLWALLLCGVAALAAMAWRLTRQLKDAEPPAAQDRSGPADPSPPN